MAEINMVKLSQDVSLLNKQERKVCKNQIQMIGCLSFAHSMKVEPLKIIQL